MIRRVVGLLWPLLILLESPTSGLYAQHPIAVAPGARIRVQTQNDSTWHVGRVTRITPDTLRLRSCDSCADDVYSPPALGAIQISVGKKSRGATILTGALVGTLVGIGSGSVFAWTKTRNCPPNASNCYAVGVAIPIMGLGGLVFGTAIGISLQYDDLATRLHSLERSGDHSGRTGRVNSPVVRVLPRTQREMAYPSSAVVRQTRSNSTRRFSVAP